LAFRLGDAASVLRASVWALLRQFATVRVAATSWLRIGLRRAVFAPVARDRSVIAF